MSSNTKKISKQQKSKLKAHNYYLVPIILILTLVPLIVRSHTYSTKLSDYPWLPDGSFNDFFLYWKSFIFILISIFISCIIIFKLSEDRKKIKFTPIFIPLGIYSILSFLSSIFSNYAYFSFHGIYEQFESIWVLLGYCLITYYSFLYINKEDDLRKIFRWFIVGIALISLIGISQAFFNDFYRTTIGKLSILPSSEWSTLDTLDFNFDPGRVYTSLYNPNYVGIYVGLITPIILALIFFNKKIKYTIGYITILIGLLICLFGSQSRSGIIALSVSLLFMAYLFRSLIFKQWKFVLSGFLIIIVTFLIINHMSNNNLYQRVIGIFNTVTTSPVLSDIQTNDDNITINYNNEPLIIRFNVSEGKNSFVFDLTDKDSAQVPYTVSADAISLVVNDNRFPGFTLSAVNLTNELLGFLVNIDGKAWYFTNQSVDGTYYLFNSSGKLDKIKQAQISSIKINPNFGSGRGFLWARTLPLLKKHIILGSGADTFSIVYPNNDYVEKYNYGYDSQFITKPHCMYLQMGVQTGLLSLIAFLVFYFMYFISSIKLYFNYKFDTYMSQVGAAILAGTLGYMVAGLTNDSTITVAPIFWCLIGIGLAINYKLKEI